MEEARARRKSRYAKRVRSFNGGSSKNRLKIQYKPRFKKRISSQVPSMFLKNSCYRMSKSKFKKGNGTNSPFEKPTWGKCSKKN